MQIEKNKKINEAIDLLIEGGVDLKTVLSQNGLIKELTKGILERALHAEMSEHLGYSKYDRAETENARNGSFSKNLISENGTIELNVPRDRQGKFEPIIVSKKQTRIDGLDQKIISLYAKGMSVSDIKTQLQELYGAEISESLISRITDEVIDEVKIWQSRPLESVYPIVYFDCLVVKVRQDKLIINKSVYVALGIDLSGRKDILGLWISENEGAKFWLGNFTEMKNRGVKDILIACSDNLTGMSDAIASVYPKTEHQICIVHQIRNSLKYVSYKDRKQLAADLKLIYTSATEKEAELALESFDQKWSKQYPHIAKSWYNNWDNLIIFLQYPKEIRKIIYTTNAIESLNSQLRKVTKNKRIFPNDDAVFKVLYLTIDYITKKWSMPIPNWNEAMAHFMIKFDGNLMAHEIYTIDETEPNSNVRSSDFVTLPSYTRFIALKPRVLSYLVLLLEWYMQAAQSTGVSYIDATSLEVRHRKRISRNKVFAGIAALGKTTKSWFFGLKLHLVINEKGEIQGLKLTPGNVDDRAPVSIITKHITGLLFGDKGYIKQELFDDLYSKGIKLVTGIKKKMKNKLMPLFEKILLRKRSIIETVFSVLKGAFELEHTRHRSIWNAFVHILSALIAYCMKPNKPAISQN